MTDIVDSAARQAAIDPTRSFLVQAPAGSGKTELLVQRFLSLLTRVEAPEEIVAISFTRKSAAEMRERLMRSLRWASENENPSAPYQAQTHLLAQQVLKRDQEQGWFLLQQPSRLRMKTVDSLCLQIVSQSPLLARGMTTVLEPEEQRLIVEEVAQEVFLHALRFESSEGPLHQLLIYLDGSYQSIIRGLVQLLHRRHAWAPLLFPFQDEQSIDYAQFIHYQVQVVIEFAWEQLWLQVDPVTLERLWQVNQERLKYLEPEAIWYRSPLEEIETVETYFQALQSLKDAVVTKGGAWRKKVTKREGFPASEKELKLYWEELTQEIQEETDLGLWTLFANLPDPTLEVVEQQPAFLAIAELFRQAYRRLLKYFLSQGKGDFSEILETALRIVSPGSDGAISDAQLYWDYRIQHLLFDEFQDTSLSQGRLLESLVEGWQPGDGRTLFLVGDPMQSIYRFREAEVGLFLRYRKSLSVGDVAIEFLRLEVNFRSRKGLVDWFNHIFTDIFPKEENILTSSVPVSLAVGERPSLGESGEVVQLEGDLETEAAFIGQRLQSLLQDQEGTIAVLGRSRSHIQPVIHEIRRLGLSFGTHKLESLAEQTVVQELLNLTLALGGELAKGRWLGVLLNRWVGLHIEDVDRIALATSEDFVEIFDQNWQELGVSPEGCLRLEQLTRAWRQNIYENLSESFSARVEAVFRSLEGWVFLQSIEERQQARHYFEILTKIARGILPPSRLELQKVLRETYVQAKAEARIQFLTIHASKGLEFDHVIVVGAGKSSFGQDSKPLLREMEAPVVKGAQEYLLLLDLVSAKNSDANIHSVYNFIHYLDQQRESSELARLLYVAVTRARETLLVTASSTKSFDKAWDIKKGRATSFMQFLYPVLESELTTVNRLDHNVLPQTEDILQSWWRKPFSEERLEPSYAVGFDLAQPENRLVWLRQWCEDKISGLKTLPIPFTAIKALLTDERNYLDLEQVNLVGGVGLKLSEDTESWRPWIAWQEEDAIHCFVALESEESFPEKNSFIVVGQRQKTVLWHFWSASEDVLYESVTSFAKIEA